MKKFRILGKGKTALALKNRFPESQIYDDSDFDIYDKESDILTVVSPGIPPHNKLVEASKNIISDYDLFYDDMPFSIWISGTNGKTTTTQMCQHILEKYGSAYGGNIGVPLSKLDKSKKIWILETSSFTLHYTQKAKPNIYILLPISEDHITWHGTYEEYKKAKLKPLELMFENDIVILPREFANIKTKAHTIYYSCSDDLCEEFKIDKSKINFNEPFLIDSIMALSTSKILFDEVDYDLINSFKIDKHKVEEFKDKKNRVWIDDSKATNVDATINALVPFQNRNIHIILGGDDKGANLSPLFENIKHFDIVVYAIGSNTKKIVDFCKENRIKVFECLYLEIAVQKIDKNMKDNSIAILSPAAASLDQFKSYAQRGEIFKEFVKNLS
ncbi:UDP-N-acetylmuramoyl-L-alanine--D-glutamate ligase [Aliarcobacter skirrowii]|uniref:UDP-N-acetylmuramoylalanine--D-glutamate ligase n=1 Tax=Aliarcobacter skirrowii TaxID=28200 RepID=A0A2U2C2E3_9BACT|nr:UDP-N-acetylmuramoyl-L-alanine--D-glutamate ligase [Aliarcobacter skirrowii]PWE22920.1 UDP-N-acetylmuramoyl-L-alanine--D-glutamate ligase [Aliarcobacter skirrowii]PWE23204.1 UDP-N-acetylmuramoyl-L-alanine--D-glutamate ligase [Aliarcobacter skirrowii]PWE26440.1 UDP-N-acetylmuramoyl-L-alanine--D-glutamate ligase [Aliarcobacter skirrowii]RJO56430.1 UDP-N-acetylmuramoyl-L-alanine--D-glutamate ligase [Aliarcobacter skirrowii]RJO58385.1 UDP-N-acetylmuramoyl-L-alanine--D-glutamate ligase [Aliarcob